MTGRAEGPSRPGRLASRSHNRVPSVPTCIAVPDRAGVRHKAPPRTGEALNPFLIFLKEQRVFIFFNLFLLFFFLVELSLA